MLKSIRSIGPFEVSAIGLGCMNMVGGYGPLDPARAEALLVGALEAGYTFFDTAEIYGNGESERIIGKALAKRRDEFVLATKAGIHGNTGGGMRFDGRPEAIRNSCEGSLRRLKTEVIDLYYLHRRDPEVPLAESVGEMARLVEGGKVRCLGLSEVSTAQLREAHSVHPITAVQSEYSLWSRTPEAQMLDACAEMDIAFVPFSPLGRAFLADGAEDVTQLAENDLRATIARPRFEPENFKHNRALLPKYRELAKQAGCTPAQLALAWLLAREAPRLIPIPGTRSIAHMQENAAAAEVALAPDLVAALDELINESSIRGPRYTEDRMQASDAERDRL